VAAADKVIAEVQFSLAVQVGEEEDGVTGNDGVVEGVIITTTETAMAPALEAAPKKGVGVANRRTEIAGSPGFRSWAGILTTNATYGIGSVNWFARSSIGYLTNLLLRPRMSLRPRLPRPPLLLAPFQAANPRLLIYSP